MAPKKRSSHKHLPQRVYVKHGAYYYVTITNKWIRLGRTFGEAMSQWSKLIESPANIHTMNQLFDKYMIEVAPLKSPKTYQQNKYEMVSLRVFFGDMFPEDVLPTTIYKYLDVRSKVAKVGANREKSLLSHCFSMAIRWGVVKDNPCRNVVRLKETPRKRYIEDWEYIAVKSIAPEMVQHIMDFAYITGQRIGDILKIKLSDLSEHGIKIDQGKTGKKINILWTDELKRIVDKVKNSGSIIRSMILFCNNSGKQYTSSGFSTVWQKTIKKALSQNLISEIFTFHDIRAKTRSDASNRIEASELLGHSDPKITDRVYNRKASNVKPIK